MKLNGAFQYHCIAALLSLLMWNVERVTAITIFSWSSGSCCVLRKGCNLLKFCIKSFPNLWADIISYHRKLSLIKQCLCVGSMSFLDVLYCIQILLWGVHGSYRLSVSGILIVGEKKKEKSTHNVYGDTASFIFSTLIIFMWLLISQLSAPHRWRDYLQCSVWPGSTPAAILISIWSSVTPPACQLVQFSDK